MDINSDEWEEIIPGTGGNIKHMPSEKRKLIKKALEKIPDEEYINPEEKLREDEECTISVSGKELSGMSECGACIHGSTSGGKK